MPKFNLSLQDPNSVQRREMSVIAEDAFHAKQIAGIRERKIVDFSLLPKEPEAPERPSSEDPVEWEAYESSVANYEDELASYPARLEDSQRQLTDLDRALRLDDVGKVVGPYKGRTRANWHAHYQNVPYEVVSVEQAPDPEIAQLVSMAKRLQESPEQWKETLRRMKAEGIPLSVVTGFIFGVPVKNQWDGTAVTDWDTDTIKCSLHTSTYTPAQDTHDFFNDITNEITGTGYTAGGATLGTKTTTYDTASDQIRLDAADTSWATSTLTARYACVYKSTGTSTTSPVLGLVDFGADVSTTAGTFQITWDATGILVFDVT